jgi:hypothetical protein
MKVDEWGAFEYGHLLHLTLLVYYIFFQSLLLSANINGKFHNRSLMIKMYDLLHNTQSATMETQTTDECNSDITKAVHNINRSDNKDCNIVKSSKTSSNYIAKIDERGDVHLSCDTLLEHITSKANDSEDDSVNATTIEQMPKSCMESKDPNDYTNIYQSNVACLSPKKRKLTTDNINRNNNDSDRTGPDSLTSAFKTGLQSDADITGDPGSSGYSSCNLHNGNDAEHIEEVSGSIDNGCDEVSISLLYHWTKSDIIWLWA